MYSHNDKPLTTSGYIDFSNLDNMYADIRMRADNFLIISRYAELGLVAVWCHRHSDKHPFIRGAYRSMAIPGRLLKSITITGAPLLINETLWSMGVAIMNQCYSTCGLDVVPAMNISTTLINLSSVVYHSLGVSVGILMGQMLGARRSEEEVRDTNRKLIAFSVSMGVLLGRLIRNE